MFKLTVIVLNFKAMRYERHLTLKINTTTNDRELRTLIVFFFQMNNC